jgi:hypothetical protein
VNEGYIKAIHLNLIEMESGIERLESSAVIERRIFTGSLWSSTRLEELIDRTRSQYEDGFNILLRFASALDESTIYMSLREQYLDIWFEEKEAVTEQIRQAVDSKSPSYVWAQYGSA